MYKKQLKKIVFTHFYDFLRRFVMFPAVIADSLKHGIHEFRVPLLEIDLSVGIAKDLLRGSSKRSEILDVRQYAALVPTIHLRVVQWAQHGLQLRLHELVERAFHVNQS